MADTAAMKRALRFGLSMAITIAALYWTFKDTDARQFLASLRGARWSVLVPYGCILAFIHLLRTLRWGNLLSAIEKVPFRKLNEASAIGFMMLMILPLRLGEFARPLLIAQRTTIRRSAAMASVVLERIVDGVIIAILLRVLLTFIPGEPGALAAIRVGANIMFCVFGGGLVLLLVARWKHDWIVRAIANSLGRISPGTAHIVSGVVDGFIRALRQLPDRKNAILFFVWTALYWLANGIGVTILANAFDCDHGTMAGCSPLQLSPLHGFLVLCVSIVGLMIPAGPASTGTYQSFIKLALSAFLPAQAVNGSGVAFANVIWLLQILPQIAFGLLFMTTSKESFSQLIGALRAEEGRASRESA